MKRRLKWYEVEEETEEETEEEMEEETEEDVSRVSVIF